MIGRWHNTPELFIMRCRLQWEEGRHLSLFPCMRKESYQAKEEVVSPLKTGVTIAHLQRGRGSRYQTRKWLKLHEPSLGNQLLVLVVFSFTIASCAPNARIVNETATGGTVLYSYVEEYDVLTSPGRKEAIRLLDEKCPSGYRVSREGEVPRISKAVDRAWMGQVSSNGQVSREKDWAIQFACR